MDDLAFCREGFFRMVNFSMVNPFSKETKLRCLDFWGAATKNHSGVELLWSIARNLGFEGKSLLKIISSPNLPPTPSKKHIPKLPNPPRFDFCIPPRSPASRNSTSRQLRGLRRLSTRSQSAGAVLLKIDLLSMWHGWIGWRVVYTCICFFFQILIVCVELDEGLFVEMHVQHFF